ncbi:MAG: NPCBM/NEW2 domain-containing protein [Planctomycetota bacterium]
MARFIHAFWALVPLLAGAAAADVLVTTLEGRKPARGISLKADGREVSLQSAEGKVLRIPTPQVVEIVTIPPPATPPPATRPYEVELIDGSRLRGVLGPGKTADDVSIKSPVLGSATLGVSLDLVLAVRRVDGARVPGSSRLVRIPDVDAAYRLSGARVEGTVARFHGTGVEIDRGDLGRSEISYRELAAVFVANEPQPRPDGLHVVARLADGSAVVLTKEFLVAGGRLRGRTPSGLPVHVAIERVHALGFAGGSFVHLSDLTPQTVKREPFFALPEGPVAGAMLDFVCPVRIDRSPDGRPITLNKRPYFKGIGVRPRTELTYALEGRGFKTFRALLGIDDEVLGPGYGRGAGTGSVVFIVQVDGRTVFTSQPVEGGKTPVTVSVPVTGAKTLTLIVSLVPETKMPKGMADGPELDNAVWARPLLIR